MPRIPKNAKFPKTDIWLSVSEAADLAGVGNKTIRRALKESDVLEYKIVKDRYKIELESVIKYVSQNIKLSNKFIHKGLGQHIDKLEMIK